MGYFVFAIHFHQPTGQLKPVLERVYENSYRLLLEVFREFSDLKFAIHVSGPLLLYALEHYPEWVEGLAKLQDYGVAEFLAGSLGEAILPVLPEEDRALQVREYMRVFERHFGRRPRGLWLPERVWEPQLVRPLAESGIEYVLLDDSTLSRAGRGSADSLYAWLTEDSGHRLAALFIDTGLRYVLPWEHPDRVLEYMRGRLGGREDAVLVWGSDAEKFGEWRDAAWARWWLREFLDRMRRAPDIKMEHPGEYLKRHGVRGLVYLPPGSYDKMLEWSGGFFRNFITKYPEVNNMHKKMLWVRAKLARAGPSLGEAWRRYLLSQCNDAYWHGLFGGVYLAHLRQAIYEGFIAAEREAEEALGYFSSGPREHLVDFDYDGQDEYLFESPELAVYVDMADGGTIFELDIKPPGLEHNAQDTMTRPLEPYLEGKMNPDWYRRVSARVHLWSPDTTLADWMWNTPFKDMSDLALARHSLVRRGVGEAVLRAEGGFYALGERRARVLVEKRLSIGASGVSVDYRVVNDGGGEFVARVGVEYHLAPKLDRERQAPASYRLGGVERPVTDSSTAEASRVEILSPSYPPIVLEMDRSVEVWASPLLSLARTEKGLMTMLQGVGLMLGGVESLGPGSEFRLRVTLRLGRSAP